MNTFKPSKYQLAIKNWLINSISSAIVQAVPGSGKTTLLIWLLEFIDRNKVVALVSFGAKTVSTLAAKITAKLGAIPPHWYVKTLNALGFRPVRDYLKARGVWKITLYGARQRNGYMMPDKSMAIIWDMFPKADGGKRPPDYFLYSAFVKRLVSLAKSEGIGTSLQADTVEAWKALIARHGLELQSPKANEVRAIEIARDVLRTSNLWSEKGNIDFDDQQYLVALWDLDLPKIDIGLVDEYQDTNRVQVYMLYKMTKASTRWLLVGDSRQSIYGFRGADSDAMSKGSEQFNCEALPLSVCYRCSTSVVGKANEICPDAHVEACENAVQGSVETLNEYTVKAFKPTDAILCRNVAPLVKLAYSFIRKAIACHVLGREIGAGLIELVDKMDATGVDDLIDKLNEFQQRETGRLLDKGNAAQAESVNDRCDCVRLFVDALTESSRTIDTLKANIAKLFADRDGCLTLATIHKAKGLEYPRVYILDWHLIPSKYATQDWQLMQEKHLQFVAVTRAMVDLYFIDSEGMVDDSASASASVDLDAESETLEVEASHE